MTRRGTTIALFIGLLFTSAVPSTSGLTASTADRSELSAVRLAASRFERHHYSMTARVRPLVLFWISRSGVGDAVVTARRAPGEADYSLLIGSDPERAPRRINRWGYIDEQIRGADAKLIGLMTESDEDSIEDAEANIRRQASGDRNFKIIQATIDGDQARSVVRSIDAPAAYSFRQVHILLDLAKRETGEGASRIVKLPAGARPGFLSALADLMHAQCEQLRTNGSVQPGQPIKYVYHGRIYELRGTRARTMSTVSVGNKSYDHAIAADFEIRSTHDSELTRFSMTYGTDGSFAEVPFTMSYQPRWWLQVDLALDDAEPGVMDVLNR
jgi:hypothetical protein